MIRCDIDGHVFVYAGRETPLGWPCQCGFTQFGQHDATGRQGPPGDTKLTKEVGWPQLQSWERIEYLLLPGNPIYGAEGNKEQT